MPGLKFEDNTKDWKIFTARVKERLAQEKRDYNIMARQKIPRIDPKKREQRKNASKQQQQERDNLNKMLRQVRNPGYRSGVQYAAPQSRKRGNKKHHQGVYRSIAEQKRNAQQVNAIQTEFSQIYEQQRNMDNLMRSDPKRKI